MLTLNQLSKSLSNFASAHYQVKSFGIGDIGDFATSGVTQYPAMWVDLEPDAVKEGVFENTIRVYLCDMMLKDQSNFVDVFSDMQSVCLDLIAHLDSPDYFPQANTRISTDNITLTPIREQKFDDEVLGYYMDITFRGNFLYDRCQIPFNSTIPTGTGSAASPVSSLTNVCLYTFTALGTDTYSGIVGDVSAYALFQSFRVFFTNANTTNATMNINSLGAKPIVNFGNAALVANDIKAGQILDLVYDGSSFQILSVTCNIVNAI